MTSRMTVMMMIVVVVAIILTMTMAILMINKTRRQKHMIMTKKTSVKYFPKLFPKFIFHNSFDYSYN